MSYSSVRTVLCANLVALVALAIALPVAQANVLTVGGSVPPSPLSPAGPQVATISGVITTPAFSTSYTEWVYSDSNNSWCANCLTFVFQFTNSLLSSDPIGRFTVTSFRSFQLNVGTNPFGVNDPSAVDRSANGSVVAFDYTNGLEIQPGVTTPQLIIETNATKYQAGFVSAQDGTAGYGNAYVPAVPEPSTLGLMGSGLLAAGGFLRRGLRLGKRS